MMEFNYNKPFTLNNMILDPGDDSVVKFDK